MNDRTHLLAATNAACLLLVFTALPCRAASAPGAKGGIPQLKPELGHTHDISPHAQKNFERGKALLEEIKAKKTSWDALSPEENALAAEAEMMKSIWKTYEPGCSWYCGGGPEGYPTSSALLPAGKINYDAKNIHDFDLSTAWVQGKAGPGIGEYVEFRFPPALRVNKVLFYNGHQKSEAAWRDNARPKQLKLFYNGSPQAILLLEDTRALQTFSVGPFGSRESPDQWVLRFEILEGCPGDKYEDVALSEIEFDGLDVHCFVAGTKVALPCGNSRPIETL